MNRVGFVLIVLLGASLCFGQAATAGAPAAAPNAVGHGAFPVKVTKTMDSSKLKDGDAVEVETAGTFKLPDGTLVPKGSKLTGHVAASKARSKGDSDSQLTMTFDKLDITNGKPLSIKGAVQAVFPPQDNPDPQMAGSASIAAGGGIGSIGSVPTKSGSNTQADTTAQPTMTPNSVGVQGLHDLDLKDGVLTSKGKTVKLNGGVRMIVHVDILG